MQMSICSIIFTSLFVHLMASSQWIDPHSMDTDHKKFVINRSQNSPGQNRETCTTVIHKESDSDVHFRRIVRIILNNAFLDEEPEYHAGYINVRLSSDEHQFLVNFARGDKTEDGVFGEISHILENAFQKPASERYQESILSFQERVYAIVFNPTSTLLFGAAVMLLVTYKLLKAQFTWWSIIKYFLLLAYITDCVVTYLNIMTEEEVQSMVDLKTLGAAPPECDPQKMSWWGYVKVQLQSTFGDNPCKVYYRATYQNYFYIIAPSKILVRQFRTILVEPCGDIGEAFGKFGRGLFTTLPWGLNFVLFPLMLVTACALVFIVFLFTTQPQFKISLFHLFTIELGKSSRQDTVHALNHDSSRRPISYTPNRYKTKKRAIGNKEVGLTSNHRALVEDVSNDNSSSHGGGQKEIKKRSPTNKGNDHESTNKSPKKRQDDGDK